MGRALRSSPAVSLPKWFGRKLPKGGQRLPSTLALVCVVLLAAWMGDADGGYFVGAWAPLAFVLAALAPVVAGVGFLGSARLRLGALALGLFTAYTAWTLASLLWSPNKGDAWLGAGQTLLYLLVFWLSVSLVASGASRRWVLAASVAGPAVIAALTLPALGPQFDDFFNNNRLIGTVGYYNGEAAFLLVPFWVAMYLGGSRSFNPFLRGAVLAGATLCFQIAVLTQSRGAMVAMAVSLPVYFLLSGQRLRGLLALVPVAAALYLNFGLLNDVYSQSANGGNPVAALEKASSSVWLTVGGAGLYGLFWGLTDRRWRLPQGVVRVVGVAVLAGVLVLAGASFALLNERTGGGPVALAQQKWEEFKYEARPGQGDQTRYASASGSGRYELWRVAYEDFTARPVLGVGTQNYEATYYRLRQTNVGPVRQPHMLPLEVVGERGVVGGALFFGTLAVCMVTGLGARFRSLRPEGKAQVGALVAAVGYWFVHSSAEWFWQLPAVTLPAVVYLALLVSPWRGGSGHSLELPRWPLRACGAGIAVLTVLVVAPLYMAERNLARSEAATDPQQALAAVERAQDFNPMDPNLPQREAELAMDTGDWERVESSYARAIELNPQHYEPYMLLATYHERRGQLEEARLYGQKALALNPRDLKLQKMTERLEGAEPGG